MTIAASQPLVRTPLRTTFLRPYYGIAAGLLVVLFVANVIALPQFVGAKYIIPQLAVVSPLILAAMATTPAVLAGGGGIDLSVGPLMGLVNVSFIVWLEPKGLDSLPTALPLVIAACAAVGALNGLLVTVLRIQPIVATLCSYLALSGLALRELPTPQGQAPHWVERLGDTNGSFPGPLILVCAAIALWLAIRRSGFFSVLYAVGGDDRAAYSAGISVSAVRVLSYMFGSVLAGLGGLALTALIDSGDASRGADYTLSAIAAVAVGGTALGGGRGGMVGSALGAVDLFLLGNLLTSLHVASLWLPVVYGAVLVSALVAGAALKSVRSQEGGSRQ